MERYCENVPQQAHVLARSFWPGPLTVVLDAKPVIPEIVRAGGKTVGRAAVLAEGDAADRKDIIFLEKLPVFPK